MKALQPDDVCRGDIVTVLTGCKYEVESGVFGIMTTTRTVESQGYKGCLLRVEEIDLPFVVLSKISSCAWETGPFSLDLRTGWVLAKPSEQYARALGYTGPMSATNAKGGA